VSQVSLAAKSIKDVIKEINKAKEPAKTTEVTPGKFIPAKD
jgi:hypothetical protein